VVVGTRPYVYTTSPHMHISIQSLVIAMPYVQ
jgi:hypothetical protein